ncbi:uncharacterized protein EKO05_0001180 [Ascochyta rabiei]|uniref:Uncharacterized protein n=1 Tax=Didymella rabiei TaxID=5454 RepID=A0A162VWN1_DIDRA|nr:uncharacterized protein EKO05_0001180 [Ascochyta rabiei]KZM18648.1 hypothetical protein ST47_g10210 [Ascochyta rabiei]UPX10526.1 hypothetical protein EKO05_0001180 [Ascochyta rabiei]
MEVKDICSGVQTLQDQLHSAPLTLTCSEAGPSISVEKRNLQDGSHQDQPHTTSSSKTGSAFVAKTQGLLYITENSIAQVAKTDLLIAYRLFYPEDFTMSSYGSAHSGHLHPGFQPASQQQRARSQSNPPYPTTPASASYPQQQQGSYFPQPPTAPYQQPPSTSNPIAIPTSNRRRSSGYTHGHGTSPLYPPPSSPYSNSYPVQHLAPILQQQPIPENYQYSPPSQPAVMSGSPTHHHHRRRRSSSSAYGYDPRQSYESARSYQSAHAYHDYPPQHSQIGYGNYDDRYNYGNGNEGQASVYPDPMPVKEYGDWDKKEVSKYHKNRDLERRPTLGGSLMSLVRKGGMKLNGERR